VGIPNPIGCIPSATQQPLSRRPQEEKEKELSARRNPETLNSIFSVFGPPLSD
jgi:hypothetical protein